MRLIYRQLLYGFPSVLIILNIKNLVSCRYLVLWGNLSSLIQPEVSRKTQLQLLATCCRLTLLPSSIVRYNFQMNVNEKESLTILPFVSFILQFDLLLLWRKNMTYVCQQQSQFRLKSRFVINFIWIWI